MQRLLKGFAVGILCLQWSLPALAADAICEIVPEAPPRLLDRMPDALATELKATGYFVVKPCSCPEADPLNPKVPPEEPTANPSSNVLFSIIGSNTYGNGSAEITPPTDLSYSLSPNSRQYDYSVKISNMGVILLPGPNYFVEVKFELVDPPQCQDSKLG
jgi:hypothetical protein